VSAPAKDLLRVLDELGATLRVDGERLAIVGDQRALGDPQLMAALRARKPELIALVTERARIDGYRIPEGTARITPEMLPLVALTQAQIDAIARAVPGGAAGIQDIYPLAPLQEGILFHHRLRGEGDAYVLPTLLRFDSRDRLDGFVRALDEVVARHDILRTSVHWEGLDAPVQVVWRHARVEIETLAAGPDAVARLEALADPRRVRLDLGRAPLVRGCAARDTTNGRWLLQLLHHHLVLDHTASALLVREVVLILQDRRAELPAPVAFRGFVARARRGRTIAEHEAYFRAQLGDIDAPTAPFDLLDVQGDGADLRTARAELEPELARRLRRQARDRGVSAACLFHLAWARVLACCTGRDDVVFGTVLFGRLHAGADAARAIGMFLNTLPLRVRIGDDSVEQAVKRTHASLIELVQHEHAPLSLAQRASAVPAHLPLFTSLLNYRHSHVADGPVFDGIEHLGGHDRTNYPVVLHVDDLGDGFAITAETDATIDPVRVRDFMARALGSLAAALERAPATAMHAVEVLPAAERARVVDGFNATATAYPGGLLHQLFEQQAAQRPEAIAVCYEDRQVRYGELEARSNRLARRLRALGVAPDAMVGVLMQRSEGLPVALLATLKAGGAYLPLDPAAPDERLARMMGDAAPAAVIADAALVGRVPPCGAPVVVIEDEGPLDLGGARAGDDGALDPAALGLRDDHLAYVIYTSGSTGEPKGAMNEHRAIVNRLLWMQDAYGLGPDDAVLHKTPFGFDVSVWELFWPLMVGARLVIARPDGHKDPAYLGEVIRDAGVTTLHFVPSMLRAFLADAGAVAGCARVVRMICSGEALAPALVQAARAVLPHVALHNLYGPTEAAVDVTAWACRGDETTVPIGRPIANTRMYVLDGRRQPVPVGVAGELWIGGVQVGRGYLHRPELTAERFVADPFVEGGRMYRTGDLGRWRDDGALEYLGRNDFQVKIRGVRIELGEIEAQLTRVPGVREAVVMAREDVAGDPRLVAYVVVEGGVTPEGLRGQLGARLPEAMVPAAYVVLGALPLSANGKLDRKALPAPDGDAVLRRAYAAPEGEIETALAQIWSELLNVERVSRNDSFFELGGHSLLAVQLVERLSRRRWTIDIRALFKQPVLAAMAAAVRVERDADRAAIEVPRNAIPAQPAAVADDDETEEFRL
jgi:amino acid adenylation domain-containing protein